MTNDPTHVMQGPPGWRCSCGAEFTGYDGLSEHIRMTINCPRCGSSPTFTLGADKACQWICGHWIARFDPNAELRDGADDVIMPVRWGGRDVRQRAVMNWAQTAFGVEEATSLPQRGLRLLEEALEAFQACGGDEAMAHKLATFVFARPKGEIGQELGGVAVTVLALAEAAGLSAEEEECREIRRVLSKPTSHFTERNANKNAAGFKVP